MKKVSVSRKNFSEFFEVVDSMTFSPLDEREAFEMGYTGVKDALRKRKRWETRYYVLYAGSEPIAVVSLERDGNFAFFTSAKLDPKYTIRFVRAIKRLVNRTVRCAGGIRVDVVKWHTQAVKLLKVLGFKL
jgi:hypothetical protein